MIPVVGMLRRRHLLALLKKLEATSLENAITLQEISENCGRIGIEPLRSFAIARGVEALVRIGKIKKTEDNKFYLSIRK